MTVSADLQTAIDAAAAAGQVLRRKWPQVRQVKYKGPRDIVTDADLAAQQAIAEIVKSRFPQDTFLGEEGPGPVDFTGPERTWIVDPLDGTTNYSRHFPKFAVAVALAQDGQIQLGVVSDPLAREMFFAERGQGAFVTSGRGRPQPLRVTDTGALSDAVVGFDWPHDPQLRALTVQGLGRVATVCRTLRAIGSAALAMTYVAAGRLDSFFHLSLQPWDVAAGVILIAEAGGMVTRLNGKSWRLGEAQVTASNGLLHTTFLETLALEAPQP